MNGVDTNVGVPFPDPDRSVIVLPPPGEGPGNWAGGPSSVAADGEIYLAYRLRRPVGLGRGYANVVARSADGVSFETVTTLHKDEFGTESLERPALVRTPDGAWRLYVSCATAGTKHWQVELLEADHPSQFTSRSRRVVLPGDPKTAVKDPVIRYHDSMWHLWASVHLLTDPHETDQMTTDYATSADGIDWTWHGTALSGRPGHWDARGTRASAVCFVDDKIVAAYDGRATAAENYEERTGIATGAEPAALTQTGSEPLAVSPFRGGGLRYLDLLELPGGGTRLYYEMTRADGAHELRTELR